MIMAHRLPEEELGEAQLQHMRKDIVELLRSWLEEEVNQRFQQIDQKLNTLLASGKKMPRNNLAVRSSQRMQSCRSSGIVSAWSLRDTGGGAVIHGPRINIDPSESAKASHTEVRPFANAEPFERTFTPESPPHRATSYRSALEDGKWKRSRVPSIRLPSVPMRRDFRSVTFLNEVQEAIAQNHGRGPTAVAVWRFLEDPYSSLVAWLYSIFIPVVVITSVLISLFHTVEDSPLKGNLGIWMQAAFEVVYVTELIVRFCVCPDRCAFFFSGFNWIDAVSSLPLLLRIFARDELENDSNSVARAILVSGPLVRLLKIIRRFEKFQLLVNAFSLAFEALPVLLYTLLLIALFFSVLIYFLEPKDNIHDLPNSCWFVFVTMTTVGYGDKTPVTVAGHVVAVVLMVISSLYMAIPIGIVGHAFSQAWSNRDRLLLMRRLRDSLMQEGFTADSLSKVINLFDDDGDGELDLQEFTLMLETMNIRLSAERIIMLHESIDTDGGGSINVDELVNKLFPKGYLEAFFTGHASLGTGPHEVTNDHADMARSEMIEGDRTDAHSANNNQLVPPGIVVSFAN